MSNGRNVAAKPQLPDRAAAAVYFRGRGFSQARVDKARGRPFVEMVRELHGVSEAEYQAAKRKASA